MNESVNGDANPATNHKGDGLKDTPNSSRGGCACWLLIVKPDKTGLIIKYRCPHLHRWPELPLNLSLWLYFTKCYCSAIMDAWRSFSFFYISFCSWFSWLGGDSRIVFVIPCNCYTKMPKSSTEQPFLFIVSCSHSAVNSTCCRSGCERKPCARLKLHGESPRLTCVMLPPSGRRTKLHHCDFCWNCLL